MKRKKLVYSIDENGEIKNESLGSGLESVNRNDNPFESKIVPYIIMIICATVDAFVFYSMFKYLSYDSPLMICIQLIGFLFAFDVVPIFIGLELKRIKQGLKSEKTPLIIGAIVSSTALTMNVWLRILTMEYLSTTGDEAATTAVTLFGVLMPVITSLGSFMISYVCFNPRKIRKVRLENAITNTKDEIRRLEAIIDDIGEDKFEENLIADDTERYNQMVVLYKAKVLIYCDYVAERIKEHLGDPRANSMLSESECEAIISKLNSEMELLS